MNEYKAYLTIIIIIIFKISLPAQDKWDYNWILGYDTSLLDKNGNAILLNFSKNSLNISSVETVSNFWMEGSNTSFSTDEGILKFYSNGCKLINYNHQILENGEVINPGLIEDIWCPYGGSPIPQGIISIPYPDQNHLAYVFNLDFGSPYAGMDSFTSIAPVHLLYDIIDMNANDGLGRVVVKNAVAIQDTFARGTLQAVRHENGTDWWIIIPKSHSNCYFLLLITASGIQPPLLSCSGRIWNDSDGGQSVFSPDGKVYARFNYQNGLNIFDFDNEDGTLNEKAIVHFSNDYFPSSAGVAISSNSHFLYVTAGQKIYQFNLLASDIESSGILIAETLNEGIVFNLAALAPDEKIYIAGRGSSKYLHVINSPNCLGLAADVDINGISLPSFNFTSIPNYPHYRSIPVNGNCDTTSLISIQIKQVSKFRIYPNPTCDRVFIETPKDNINYSCSILDPFGKLIKRIKLESWNVNEVELSTLNEGLYFIHFQSDLLNETQALLKL